MLLGDQSQRAPAPEVVGRGSVVLVGRAAEVEHVQLVGLVVGQRGRAAVVCPAVVSGPIVALLALVVQYL